MDLFEPLKVTITLPQRLTVPTRVGGNRVNRLLARSFELDVALVQSEFKGYFLLTSQLPAPYDKLYLKDPSTRGSKPTGVPVLKAKEHFRLQELCPDTPLKWEHFPTELYELSPEAITESWYGLFQFKEESPERSVLGLRRPQLGALHAISAYFATDREVEPATVVLPTGTGKTETMLAALSYHQCRKVLVIVPSDSLRTQIASKFTSFGCLPELGVLPKYAQLPAVAVIKTGIRTVQDAQALADASNVIVATTSVLSACNEQALNRLCSLCSHLFVDEAHHVSANTWAAIRERFVGKNVIQFTATPFRNDKKALGGKIIYNYTMGEAQRANYFTHIELLPVEEFYSDEVDKAIAAKAVARLREDLAKGFDHLMMARTKGKVRAGELHRLYLSLAPDLEPILVHSDFGKTANHNQLNKLLSRQSRIVICVDMLGEGYDLPNLKIAALHDYHKSLAVALQFIGRFTRVNSAANLGQASVVLNVADPAVEGDLQKLYSVGADWDTVLRRLSENRIEREVRLQEVIDALRSQGDLHDQISLWNLEPSHSAMLFHTSCEEWKPEQYAKYLPKFEECWHAIADNEKLLVVLAIQATPVKWGTYKELQDSNYKLLIAHWDAARKALFIFSNDYKTFRAEKLAEAICEEQCELLSGEKIFNVFNGMEYPLARNLGASQIGAISFTQFFGPNVTDGLSTIEKSQSSLSNIAALGYESGEKVVWGCSQRKGKVWSPQKNGSITDWIEWVKKAWDKVISEPADLPNLTRNFLRPVKLEAPHSSYPISAQWGEQLLSAFEDKVDFLFGDEAIPFYLVEVRTDGREEDGNVRVAFSANDQESVYKIFIGEDDSRKGYEYERLSGPDVSIQRGAREPIPLPEFMQSDPVTIHYADGSFSYNAHIVIVSEDVGLFNQEEIQVQDWADVNIRKESMGYNRAQDSIQWHSFEQIRDDYDVIINDDGSGESADLVGLKVLDDSIVMNLIHCKYSASDEPGARLKDLYEVCGQAQRCIRWKHLNLKYLYQHIKHRQELWLKRGSSRFLKGSIEDLLAMRDRSRTTPLKLHVTIVQPGLSAGQVTDEGLKLLGSTALYVKKTTLADLVVIGSA